MRDVEVDKLTINMTKRKEKKEGTVRMPGAKLDRAKARQGREKRLSDGEASLEVTDLDLDNGGGEEVAVRIILLDGPLERVEGGDRDVHLVGLVGRAATARDLPVSNDTPIPARHDRARVAIVGELVVLGRNRVVATDDEWGGDE